MRALTEWNAKNLVHLIGNDPQTVSIPARLGLRYVRRTLRGRNYPCEQWYTVAIGTMLHPCYLYGYALSSMGISSYRHWDFLCFSSLALRIALLRRTPLRGSGPHSRDFSTETSRIALADHLRRGMAMVDGVPRRCRRWIQR